MLTPFSCNSFFWSSITSQRLSSEHDHARDVVQVAFQGLGVETCSCPFRMGIFSSGRNEGTLQFGFNINAVNLTIALEGFEEVGRPINMDTCDVVDIRVSTLEFQGNSLEIEILELLRNEIKRLLPLLLRGWICSKLLRTEINDKWSRWLEPIQREKAVPQRPAAVEKSSGNNVDRFVEWTRVPLVTRVLSRNISDIFNAWIEDKGRNEGKYANGVETDIVFPSFAYSLHRIKGFERGPVCTDMRIATAEPDTKSLYSTASFRGPLDSNMKMDLEIRPPFRFQLESRNLSVVFEGQILHIEDIDLRVRLQENESVQMGIQIAANVLRRRGPGDELQSLRDLWLALLPVDANMTYASLNFTTIALTAASTSTTRRDEFPIAAASVSTSSKLLNDIFDTVAKLGVSASRAYGPQAVNKLLGPDMMGGKLNDAMRQSLKSERTRAMGASKLPYPVDEERGRIETMTFAIFGLWCVVVFCFAAAMRRVVRKNTKRAKEIVMEGGVYVALLDDDDGQIESKRTSTVSVDAPSFAALSSTPSSNTSPPSSSSSLWMLCFRREDFTFSYANMAVSLWLLSCAVVMPWCSLVPIVDIRMILWGTLELGDEEDVPPPMDIDLITYDVWHLVQVYFESGALLTSSLLILGIAVVVVNGFTCVLCWFVPMRHDRRGWLLLLNRHSNHFCTLIVGYIMLDIICVRATFVLTGNIRVEIGVEPIYGLIGSCFVFLVSMLNASLVRTFHVRHEESISIAIAKTSLGRRFGSTAAEIVEGMTSSSHSHTDYLLVDTSRRRSFFAARRVVALALIAAFFTCYIASATHPLIHIVVSGIAGTLESDSQLSRYPSFSNGSNAKTVYLWDLPFELPKNTLEDQYAGAIFSLVYCLVMIVAPCATALLWSFVWTSSKSSINCGDERSSRVKHRRLLRDLSNASFAWCCLDVALLVGLSSLLELNTALCYVVRQNLPGLETIAENLFAGESLIGANVHLCEGFWWLLASWLCLLIGSLLNHTYFR
eukprot:g855.t1